MTHEHRIRYEQPDHFDAIVVGAGFAGLYMLHRLLGAGMRAVAVEAGSGVGGVWYWNRYPGARCDVESIEYSYSFSDELQQEWSWSERYASQPEILRYLEHVADRYELRPAIRFNTRVLAACFDDSTGAWSVETSGESLHARFLLMATGVLSAANRPNFPGAADFRGAWYHTGTWPHEGVDFKGQRVGVIGTGSSGIQAIPLIAQQADELVVFQRTPAYTVPARNQPVTPDFERSIKEHYDEFRRRNREMWPAFGSHLQLTTEAAKPASEARRQKIYEDAWALGGFAFMLSFTDLLTDHDANATAAEFVRSKVRATVKDPLVAERLLPSHVIGCKRLCLDTGYYETFERPNVRLVDLRQTPIERFTATGVQLSTEHLDLDAVVYATGFDAMTGALSRIDIRGQRGVALRDVWHDAPVNYLGLMVPGFPNMFTLCGPGSPSVLTNVVVAIEQHVEWISELLRWMAQRDLQRVDATREAAERWLRHVNKVASSTLYTSCNSWYTGSNVVGKPRVFMPLPGFPAYVARCERVASMGYEGFEFQGVGELVEVPA